MSDTGSLIFYLSFFAISALLVYAGNTVNSKTITAIGVLIPALIAALRNNVGTDYLSYVHMFETLSDLSFSEYISSSSIEIGFYLFAQIAKLLDGNHFLFLAMPAILTVILYYRGILKFSGKATWFVWLLYLIVIFPININQVRQGLSMAIALHAFFYLLNGKIIKSIGILLIASLFHFSSLLFIPMILLVHWVRSSKVVASSQLRYLMVCILAFVSIIGLRVFAGQILHLDDSSSLIKTGFNIIEQSQLIVYIILFYLMQINQRRQAEREDIGLLLLATLVPVLAVTGVFFETYERVALFVLPFQFILLAKLVSGTRVMNIYRKQALAATVILVCLAPITIMYIKSVYMEQPWIFPYYFMWENVPYIPHEKLI